MIPTPMSVQSNLMSILFCTFCTLIFPVAFHVQVVSDLFMLKQRFFGLESFLASLLLTLVRFVRIVALPDMHSQKCFTA